MTTNAQIGLQTVLALLGDINSVTRGVEGFTFNGIAQTNDLFIGDAGHNTARGKEGNDILLGNDGNDHLFGDADNDALFGGNGADILKGGNGNDKIMGDAGDDLLVGDSGVDRLTGGEGRDRFAFTGDAFANGIPAPAGKTGINVLNQPDVISDFTIGEDQFALNGFDLDLNALTFQKGQVVSNCWRRQRDCANRPVSGSRCGGSCDRQQ